MQAYFPHPCDENKKVYIFLDACHMIKLVRNTFSDWKVLKDKDGQNIEWKFLEELNELQEREGLRLANKLCKAHIKWKPQKMKVNLAAQSLSSSIADALEFCEGKLQGMPQFDGCGPTVKFICIFDRLLDILNFRNPRAKTFKAPIRKTNYEFVNKFLDEACEYIRGLKGPEDVPIVKSKCKTGFLGFLMCVEALRGLVKDLICGKDPVLKYVLCSGKGYWVYTTKIHLKCSETIIITFYRKIYYKFSLCAVSWHTTSTAITINNVKDVCILLTYNIY